MGIGEHQIAVWRKQRHDPAHAELIVLTTCRVWRFAEERRHCSKSEAGEWALKRDPGLMAVREALQQRRVDPTSPIDEEPVRELLDVAWTRIADAARRARP